MKSLQVGDCVPALTLNAHDGRKISLSDFKGKQTVVLYFYAMDNTAICTREACSFRDAYQDFLEAGAVVIGVSGDSASTHRSFAQMQRLPYLLVSDADKALRRAFGVPAKLWLLPGRVTYVIDRDGVVRHVFNSQFSGRKHAMESLRIARCLSVEQRHDP